MPTWRPGSALLASPVVSPVVAWPLARTFKVSILVSLFHLRRSSWWPSTCPHASGKGEQRGILSVSWAMQCSRLRPAPANAGLDERPEWIRSIRPWLRKVVQLALSHWHPRHGRGMLGKQGIANFIIAASKLAKEGTIAADKADHSRRRASLGSASQQLQWTRQDNRSSSN
jgi:hypothetical protein